MSTECLTPLRPKRGTKPGTIPWNKGKRWLRGPSRVRPDKPDPDVIALQKHYLLSYVNARTLKALSFGIALDATFMRWVTGRPSGSLHVPFQQIANRIPGFSVTRAAGGRGVDGQYVLKDQRLIAEIRRIMNGDEVWQ